MATYTIDWCCINFHFLMIFRPKLMKTQSISMEVQNVDALVFDVRRALAAVEAEELVARAVLPLQAPRHRREPVRILALVYVHRNPVHPCILACARGAAKKGRTLVPNAAALGDRTGKAARVAS